MICILHLLSSITKIVLLCEVLISKIIPFQLDQWLTNSLEYVLDSKVVNYGIPSDHSAIQLKLKFSTKRNDTKEYR